MSQLTEKEEENKTKCCKTHQNRGIFYENKIKAILVDELLQPAVKDLLYVINSEIRCLYCDISMIF